MLQLAKMGAFLVVSYHFSTASVFQVRVAVSAVSITFVRNFFLTVLPLLVIL